MSYIGKANFREFKMITRAMILLIIFGILSIHELNARAMPCASGKSGVFACRSVEQQANIALDEFQSNPRAASNLWGYTDPDDGNEYAIIGLSNGTAVVQVTNPIKPRVVGIVRAKDSDWREVKVYSVFNSTTRKWDAYAYVSTEAQNGGLQVIDLSALPNRVSLAYTDREISTSHTLFVANVDFVSGKRIEGLTPVLYVQGSNVAGLVAYSLANPKNPKIIGRYTETYVHDIYAETFSGARANQCADGHNPCEVVFASTGRDLRTIDFTDKSNPVVLHRLEYPRVGYAHSSWISSNKNWLFNFDEFDEIDSGTNTRILTINIQNFRNMRVAGTFHGREKSIEHNGYVVGNRLYLSHYTRGLVVMDVTNPTRIREIAFFDTHPEDDKDNPQSMHPGHGSVSFNGAWGVFPFLPSGNILISDMERGLFVLKVQN
jgi:choice-of-anchor B domain-containing protein